MNIIEDINFLNEEQKSKINSLFENQITPFYLSKDAAFKNDGGFHFIHHVIHRDRPNELNSDLKDFFVEILNSFCKKNNIKYKNIFRSAINITFNNGAVYKCPVHVDHPFKHKQLLIYLNDSIGDTVILNKKNEPVKIIEPLKFKGIFFESSPHFHYFPIKGIRIVSVTTFN